MGKQRKNTHLKGMEDPPGKELNEMEASNYQIYNSKEQL